MLSLKSLKISAFGRFIDEQTVNFDTLGNLVQLEGQNNNTGGSSGAAKSTLFKSIDFLLGLNNIPNGVLQSRLTKESMSVIGEFDLDGLPLTVTRGKKLSINLNGEITEGSSKIAEEKLDQIIGMPRDLFRKILHKRQRENGFFLEMGPSDVHIFMTDCLGLEKERAKIKGEEIEIATLAKKVTELESTLASYKSSLKATEDALLSLGSAPELTFDPEKLIPELEAKLKEAKETHSQVKVALDAEMVEFNKTRPQIQNTPFDRSEIEKIEKEIAAIKEQILALQHKESERQLSVSSLFCDKKAELSKLEESERNRQSEAKAELNRVSMEYGKLQEQERNRQSLVRGQISVAQIDIIKTQTIINAGEKAKEEAAQFIKELEQIRKAICFTCGQGWANDTAKAKETSILEEIKSRKTIVLAAQEASKKLTESQISLSGLKEESAPRTVLTEEEIQKLTSLENECLPRPVSGMDVIKAHIEILKEEVKPKAIPEIDAIKPLALSKHAALTAERKKEQNHQTAENTKNQVLLDKFDAAQSDLTKSHTEILDTSHHLIGNIEIELLVAKNDLRSYQEARLRYESGKEFLDKGILSHTDKVAITSTDLTRTQERLENATEAKKAIKSFLSCTFEDALESIGDTATRMIRGIPNMANATIQLDGLKETQEGKVKEEINAVISMDGEIGIPIKSLSGGERSSTDLAIDLAVTQFIEEKTGKGCNIMLLDEIFTGLDTISIQEAIEMLRSANLGKRLIIVDHNPIVAQSIESKITVIRDGSTSRIVQN